MAEITGATVDFTDYVASTTPRVLNIPQAWGDPTVQDIWDTLSAVAADLDNLIYKPLIDRPKGGGKAQLGAGKFTGITLMMNNCQVQFEPQVSKLETGTVTTGDTNGVNLVDSAATFITNNVMRGEIILNATDGSHSTVLRVDSETSLVATPLLGGTDNQFDIGDAYEILDHTNQNVVDGDLIAQDHNEVAMLPLLTAFGVDSRVELSTSPALVTSAISGLTAAESAALFGVEDYLEGGREYILGVGVGSDGLGWQRLQRDPGGTIIARYNLYDEFNVRINETFEAFRLRGGMISREELVL